MKPARSMLRIVSLLACLLAPAVAQAQQEPEVAWSDKWPRVRAIEVANVVALTAGSLALDQIKVPNHTKWDQPILFDKAARNLFKARTEEGQKLAGDISDAMFQWMVLGPYIVDNGIVALGVHQNADVALQMTIIDMQSLGVAGVLSIGLERTVGRSRPYLSDCRGPGFTTIGHNICGTPFDFQSFYSGHAAAVFAMAALTCQHHEHLPLWGGGLPDKMACAGMMSLALMTSVMRIVTDRHWASDVLIGSGIGLTTGYVLPAWLHYGFGGSDSAPRAGNALLWKTKLGYIAPAPQVQLDGASLGLVGTF